MPILSFQKMLGIGMMTETVHVDQVFLHTRPFSVKLSESEQPVPYGMHFGYQVVDWKTKKKSILIDVSSIIAESRAVLEMNRIDEKNENLNTLERMTLALTTIREKQKTPESLRLVEVTKFGPIFKMWHQQMKETSEWLMHSEEFRSLPINERIQFFKTVWGLWRRFERYTMSAQLFGKRCYDERIYVHSNQYASYLEKLHVDPSLVFNPKYDYALHSFENDWFEVVVKPFVQLNFSPTEVTYMLCQILWSYAGRRLQGQTLAASERFLEEIGNNLHQYYRKLPNMESYSARIVKMMRIVKDVLNIQLQREKFMDFAFLFEYFNVTLTDPDFFKV